MDKTNSNDGGGPLQMRITVKLVDCWPEMANLVDIAEMSVTGLEVDPSAEMGQAVHDGLKSALDKFKDKF